MHIKSIQSWAAVQGNWPLFYEFMTQAEGASPKIVGSLWRQHTSSSVLPPEGTYDTSALISVAQRGHMATPRSRICNAALLCLNSMRPACWHPALLSRLSCF